MPATIKKYSVRINNHPTSITLEPPFWDELSRIARTQGIGVHQLIARIDHARMEPSGGGGNLSSALRVYVLEWLLAERKLLSGIGGGAAHG